MSNDTQFTDYNKKLLGELGLLNVQLEKIPQSETNQMIKWNQIRLNIWGEVEKEYRECSYKIRGGDTQAIVKVFVAIECGEPPDVINTGGHKQNGGELHFGYIVDEENENSKAIFFVIHPNKWGPYQYRFRTETFLALVRWAVGEAAEKVGKKLGAKAGMVVGAAIGSAVPVVGTTIGAVAGAVAGYFVADTTIYIANALTGEYLRFIG